MFKRVTWMGIGMAVGATGAFRAKRKVEAAIDRYLPEQVADRAAASARGMGNVVRSAAQEGRAAMRATEAELRSRVEARTFVGPEPGLVTGADSPDRARPGSDAETPRPDPAVTAGQAPGPKRVSRGTRGTGPASPSRRRARR